MCWAPCGDCFAWNWLYETVLLYSYMLAIYTYASWSPVRVHILFLYPVNFKLHCVFHHCHACFSFSAGRHADGQIWPLWMSPNVPRIHYGSGIIVICYMYETDVNLMWYLFLFLLNELCLSLSLKGAIFPVLKIETALRFTSSYVF